MKLDMIVRNAKIGPFNQTRCLIPVSELYEVPQTSEIEVVNAGLKFTHPISIVRINKDRKERLNLEAVCEYITSTKAVGDEISVQMDTDLLVNNPQIGYQFKRQEIAAKLEQLKQLNPGYKPTKDDAIDALVIDFRARVRQKDPMREYMSVSLLQGGAATTKESDPLMQAQDLAGKLLAGYASRYGAKIDFLREEQVAEAVYAHLTHGKEGVLPYAEAIAKEKTMAAAVTGGTQVYSTPTATAAPPSTLTSTPMPALTSTPTATPTDNLRSLIMGEE